jgi:peroxiredoxin Q/BCP
MANTRNSSRNKIRALFLAAVGFLAAAVTQAALKAGDKAPDFSAPLSDGTTFHLADWLAKAPLVLYFYPKDGTPGCTAEACGLRDDFDAFRGLNATVVGVSYDSIASHKQFIKQNKLPFPLIADTDKKVADAFGVAGTFGAKRSTFILGRDGVILYANPSVNPSTHSREIRDVLKSLAPRK